MQSDRLTDAAGGGRRRGGSGGGSGATAASFVRRVGRSEVVWVWRRAVPCRAAFDVVSRTPSSPSSWLSQVSAVLTASPPPSERNAAEI